MNRFGLLALTCCLVPLASAQDTVQLLPSPLEMPRRIGPLVNDGQPHQFDPAELGIAYQYNADGLSLTIYVYDLGIQDIADGPDTPATCEQFEEAKQGVYITHYENTVFKGEQLVRLAPPEESPLAREAKFEFDINKRPAASYVWITGVAGNFIKLRFSVDAQLKDEVPEARRAILTALGEAVKPYLQPVVAKTDAEQKKDTGISINIHSIDGASQDDLTAGMMYLMFLSAMADTDPQSLPPCGGTIVPAFATELAAYQRLIHSELTGKSSLGQKLKSVEQAGYLQEFVWTDLHRESWGKDAPEGLKLSEYQKWRKKNLKKFKVPDFGSVSVKRVRELTLEPPDAPRSTYIRE